MFGVRSNAPTLKTARSVSRHAGGTSSPVSRMTVAKLSMPAEKPVATPGGVSRPGAAVGRADVDPAEAGVVADEEFCASRLRPCTGEARGAPRWTSVCRAPCGVEEGDRSPVRLGRVDGLGLRSGTSNQSVPGRPGEVTVQAARTPDPLSSSRKPLRTISIALPVSPPAGARLSWTTLLLRKCAAFWDSPPCPGDSFAGLAVRLRLAQDRRDRRICWLG